MAELTGAIGSFNPMSLTNPTGTLGDLVNSNCSVNWSGSGVAKSGNNITLTLNITFRAGMGNPAGGVDPGFIGQQNIYMLTTTAAAGSSSTGTLTITGTGGGLTSILNVPFTVVAVVPPSFTITSDQILQVPTNYSSASFVVGVTGLLNFPANQPVIVSVAPSGVFQ